MEQKYYRGFSHARSMTKKLVACMAILVLTLCASMVAKAAGPIINVWYGSPQKFGQIGTTQRWVNILGDIFSDNGVKSFTYTLNGGSPVDLNFLADSRRIAKEGNFNIDILVQDLNPGANTVAISVKNEGDTITTENVVVDWTPGKVWPTAYSVALTSAAALSDSVQVSDGKWTADANGVRIQEHGYDRIIMIGDSTWTDYEITAKAYVNYIDTSDHRIQ